MRGGMVTWGVILRPPNLAEVNGALWKPADSARPAVEGSIRVVGQGHLQPLGPLSPCACGGARRCPRRQAGDAMARRTSRLCTWIAATRRGGVAQAADGNADREGRGG